MEQKKRQIVLKMIITISLFSFTTIGLAQTGKYPNKPIEIIVASEPGSATDGAARIIATYLTKKWGSPVQVLNKPGGQTVLGTLEAIKAAPDGYTFLLDGHAYSSMGSAARKNQPPDILNRTYIVKMFSVPVFYIVRADAPWKTLTEVMGYARKDPKNFKWSGGGVGSVNNFSLTQLFETVGIDSGDGRVTFDGGHTPSLSALLGGHVKFAIGMMPDIKSLHPSKIRALAVTSPERIKIFPDIPTTKEAGFPGANLMGWYGVSGPPKLSDNIINLWERTMRDASTDPAFIDIANKIGHIIHFVSRKEMEAELKVEFKEYLEIAERTGIRR